MRGNGPPRVVPLSAEETGGDGGDWDATEDLGEIPFPDGPLAGPASLPQTADSGSGGEASPGVRDEPPAHTRRDWRRDRPAPASRPRSIRVTAGVRADISAKIALPLEIAGRILEARDPFCGGAFVAQRPEISDALTDIVCDSADLVAFFTGPAGGFMKYMNLAAALWPVLEVMAAHHVYHTIGPVEAPESAVTGTAGQYAA